MRKLAIVGVMAMLASLLLVVPALASHPEVSLPGSEFEIDTDANLKVDDPAPPSLDWANVTEDRKADEPTGANDDSFGEGTKEDTPVPTIVDGSIPNNKSDLLNFGVYLEEAAAGDFLNVFWQRVQEPTGTTNMDFEFNQSETLSANGVTPVRTAGDVLIQYDLASGGTNVQLFLSLWVTSGANSQCEANGAKVPCWGDRVNLTSAGLGTGSINTTAIPVADSDGLATVNPISPRTFGEAQIDFDAFTSGGGGTDPCVSFGSAYLKSRASDSFTAALKDFIAPVGLDISNCGSIEITKTDDGSPANLLDGAVFELRPDVAPLGTAPGAEDLTVDSCTTGELAGDADAGICTFTEVLQGSYWVVEVTAPAGHDLADPAFQLVTVVADETVEISFVNPAQEGAVLITKTAKQASEEDGSINLPGVTFTIEGGDLPDGGTDVVTGLDGTVCLDGLAFATDYTATETEPDNYNAVGDGVQEFTIDSAAECDVDPYVGESLTFDNVPLTDFEVSVDSLVIGGTDTQIDCVDADDVSVATGNTADATGDTTAGQVVAEDLEPGIYTCTINIDP